MYKKVIVIDDNEIDLYIAKRVMAKYSFAEEVVTFSSAIDALEYIQTSYKNGATIPELIMLDINMPEMTGFQFLDKYGALPADIINTCSIIMLSTSIHPDELKLADNSPHIQKFIGKPISGDALVKLLNERQAD